MYFNNLSTVTDVSCSIFIVRTAALNFAIFRIQR